jgi:hypothetical protein
LAKNAPVLSSLSQKPDIWPYPKTFKFSPHFYVTSKMLLKIRILLLHYHLWNTTSPEFWRNHYIL